jgi:hypothetical protein
LRLVRQLPEDAATWRSAHGDDAHWNLDRQLLAAVADRLAEANWQRAGGKSGNRPKPIPRPGVLKPGTRTGDASKLTQAQVLAVLAARAPKPTEEV